MSIAQREAALATANRNRLDRAAARRTVRSHRHCAGGMSAVAGLLEDNPACIAGMHVIALLAWPYHSQPVIRTRLLQYAGISTTMTVGALTYRQRATLVALIDEQYGPEAVAA